MLELFLGVLEFVFDVEFKDPFCVISDSADIWVFEEGVDSDAKESLQVLYGVSDSDCVEEDLKRINAHVYNTFIFCPKLQHVDDLVNYRILEVFVLTKIMFEDDLDNPYELHELALLYHGILFLFKSLRELMRKGFQERDWEVTLLHC